MEREARSPGKLILSGEHAVVQGCPALAMAVNLEVGVRRRPLPEPYLRICLPGREPKKIPLVELSERLQAARRLHRIYLDEDTAFQEVVQEPEALLALCAAMLNPTEGMELTFTSELPLGAGLGSSAAFILSLLKVMKPELTPSTLQELAVEGEHFQHGRSSGLDVAVSLQGGWLRFENGVAFPLPKASPLPPFRIYHSGQPESSTGECVDQSRRVFSKAPALKAAFSKTTLRTLDALTAQDAKEWQACVRENHRLLCELGVIPEAIQKSISLLEESGVAAKVCGAGSVRGDTAGMVLVTGAEPHPVPTHWQVLPVNLSLLGTRLIP